MDNKEFIDSMLNHTHINFYHQTVLATYNNYLSRSETIEQLAQWAIQDAQELMFALGYANK